MMKLLPTLNKLTMLTMLTMLASLAAGPALAVVLASDTQTPPSFFAPLTDVPGVVSWTVLAQATTVKAKGKMVPKYTADINALNNTDVKVQGFMMPLEAGRQQKHFLLTVTSSSCAYCLPAGPEGVVEISSKTPVKFTYGPIILSGKLAVLASDPMGLYYRLTNAVQQD